MRQENNRWLGWKRITQNIDLYILMEDKMAAGKFVCTLGIMGKTASLIVVDGQNINTVLDLCL